MLHGQKITFVYINDTDNMIVKDFKARIWDHEKLIHNLLENEVCVIGRKTQEMTSWKGPNSWIYTRNKKYRRLGIGTIHDLDDIHLFSDTAKEVYILGGISLFQKLKNNVDILINYTITDRSGTIQFPKINMKDWYVTDYENNHVWTYAKLIKKEISEDDYLNENP